MDSNEYSHQEAGSAGSEPVASEFVGGTEPEDHEHPDDSQAGWPSLPVRYLNAILSPGSLFEGMPASPPWAGAYFLTALLVAVGTALVPADLMMEMIREQSAASGSPTPEVPAMVMTLFGAGGAFVMMLIIMPLLAGFTTVVFSFIMGDEGSYRQHLSIVAHAGAIVALGTFVAIVLKIMTQDAQAVLSLGTLAPFVPDGYVYNVLSSIDLFGVWSACVVGVGVASLSKKRSWIGAAIPLLVLTVAAALVGGYFR